MTISESFVACDGDDCVDAGDREVARLGAATGEDHAAGLGADEGRDLVARLFDRPARVARRAVAARGVADDAVLPAAPWRRSTSSRRGAEAAWSK